MNTNADTITNREVHTAQASQFSHLEIPLQNCHFVISENALETALTVAGNSLNGRKVTPEYILA